MHILIILLGVDLNYSYELQVVLADRVYLEAVSFAVVLSAKTRCQHADVEHESVMLLFLAAHLNAKSLYHTDSSGSPTLHNSVKLTCKNKKNLFIGEHHFVILYSFPGTIP